MVAHGVDTLLYTVPANKVALVKWITLGNNGSTNPADVVMGIGASSGGSRIFRRQVATLTIEQIQTNVVLSEGEQLWLRVSTPASGTTSCVVSVNGALLDE